MVNHRMRVLRLWEEISGMVEIAFLLAMVLMIILILLGVPIFAAIGVSCGLLVAYGGVLPITYTSERIFTSLNTFVLIAVPLFILTGDAVVVTGLSTKLMKLADSVFGGLKTGVGTATVAGCGLFASITGSNASDAAAIGRITYNDLQSYGYPGAYAGTLVAAGATTGILIPPSIVYIVAGLILGISVSKLFLAAVIPGTLILLGVIFTNIIINRTRGYETGSNFQQLPEIARRTWEAKLALSIPVIILGGIYSGIFTPTESAAVAVLITVVFGMPQEKLSMADIPEMLERSALINALLAPILATAVLLARLFTIYQIPQAIVEATIGVVDSQLTILIFMFLVFMMGGALMETGPNIVILGPLLLPTAIEFGIDPIHFTVFMVSVLGVGFITPPFGLNLFVMSGVTGESVVDLAKEAIPFAIVLLLISLLIGFFPGAYMWLV